jgi:hypothetical protein
MPIRPDNLRHYCLVTRFTVHLDTLGLMRAKVLARQIGVSHESLVATRMAAVGTNLPRHRSVDVSGFRVDLPRPRRGRGCS